MQECYCLIALRNRVRAHLSFSLSTLPSFPLWPSVQFFAFKVLLGSPEHVQVTLHFLNAVLGDQHRITLLEFLKPFLDKKRGDDKLAVLDILATDDQQAVENRGLAPTKVKNPPA